jgi:hypothetical protein
VSSHQKVTYALDFYAGKQRGQDGKAFSERHPLAGGSIPRATRLMALAIRFEGLLREETIQDYAELARLGRVTGARMTQIMKLFDLPPDIQEQILFPERFDGIHPRGPAFPGPAGNLAGCLKFRIRHCELRIPSPP